jgi:hypothetical protein
MLGRHYAAVSSNNSHSEPEVLVAGYVTPHFRVTPYPRPTSSVVELSLTQWLLVLKMHLMIPEAHVSNMFQPYLTNEASLIVPLLICLFNQWSNNPFRHFWLRTLGV